MQKTGETLILQLRMTSLQLDGQIDKEDSTLRMHCAFSNHDGKAARNNRYASCHVSHFFKPLSTVLRSHLGSCGSLASWTKNARNLPLASLGLAGWFVLQWLWLIKQTLQMGKSSAFLLRWSENTLSAIRTTYAVGSKVSKNYMASWLQAFGKAGDRPEAVAHARASIQLGSRRITACSSSSSSCSEDGQTELVLRRLSGRKTWDQLYS